MEENIITLNIPNIITIGIIGIIMFTAFGMLSQFIKNRGGAAALNIAG